MYEVRAWRSVIERLIYDHEKDRKSLESWENSPKVIRGVKMLKIKSKLVIAVALLHALGSVFLTGPLSASIVNDLESPVDDYNPVNLDYNYDIDLISTGLESEDPDLIYFWIKFKTPISANQFVYGAKEPWAAINIFREKPAGVSSREDIQIATKSSGAGDGTSSVAASAWGNSYSGGTQTQLSNCNAKTWTNVANASTWLGFSISRSCAKIPSSFWMVGYTDPDSTNGDIIRDWDWSPSVDPWFVDLSSSVIDDDGGTYKDPQSVYFYQTPSTLITKKFVNISAEADSGLTVYFTSLTPKTCKSVNNTKKIQLIAVGTCKVSANQDGDEYYEPSENAYMSFKILKVGTQTAPVTPKATRSPSPKATTKPTSTPTPKPTSTPTPRATQVPLSEPTRAAPGKPRS